MKNLSQGESFENRAMPVPVADGIAAQEHICDNCSEPLLFAMRDKHHEFSLGLLTVLQCLELAEKEAYVPPLPQGWWLQIRRTYFYEEPPCTDANIEQDQES